MNIEKLSYDKNIIIGLKQVLGEYSFSLEKIPEIEIKVKLYKYADRNDICFETSHYIKTPEQCGPYITNRNYDNSEESALERAIETITSYYETGIANGHEPDSSWLVENVCY